MSKNSNKDSVTVGKNWKFSEEILMPMELIEQIFDSSKRIGYETPEEREYREQKEDYNKKIIDKLKTLNFTDKQRFVMDRLFYKNMTMVQIAAEMGISYQGVEHIKKAIFKKIRKNIDYDFNNHNK